MQTWTESIGYIAGDVKIDARVNTGIAKVSFNTERGIISLVSVPLDDSIDAATVLHDLLTSAAMALENAAGMNAPADTVVVVGDLPDGCTCADKSAHLPWCHLSTPAGEPSASGASAGADTDGTAR